MIAFAGWKDALVWMAVAVWDAEKPDAWWEEWCDEVPVEVPDAEEGAAAWRY
jgi:hypothetical protein